MNRKELIAARIKQARLEEGMSQKEVGKLFGSSDVTIGDMERGISNVSIPDLERLAFILDKSLEWFLSDKIESPPRPPESALSDLHNSVKAYRPVYDEIPEVSAGAGLEPVDYMAGSRINPYPETAIIYRVKGLCLEPEVKEGDKVVVDTALTPLNGDLVVVLIEGQASIKYYKVDEAGNKWLENHYGKYKPEDVRLKGVVIETIRRHRRSSRGI